MTLTEYAQLDATSLILLLRQGDITIEEELRIATQAIEKLNPVLNAIIIRNPLVAAAANRIC